MNLNPQKIIRKIGPNVDGRDFVVGDLHGCYDSLIGLLKYVKFNPSIDRLFSTGDVTDRGPKPLESIGLLHKKWFFSVLGNHEEILLNKLNMIRNNQIQSFSNQELDFLNKVKIYEKNILDLPLIYEVEHLIHGKVYITHAEILPEHLMTNFEDHDNSWSIEYNKTIDAMLKFDFTTQLESFFAKQSIHQNLSQNLSQKIIWSRKIVNKFYNNNKQFIEKGNFSFLKENKFSQNLKIFCGHNIVPFPMKIGQQYYVDTGAALGYSTKEIYADLFSQFGNDFFSLSMTDITLGICYGSITSQTNRGEIMKLEHSLYN